MVRGGLPSDSICSLSSCLMQEMRLWNQWVPADGNMKPQLQPSSNLLDAGRRRQEDQQGHPSALLMLRGRSEVWS